MFTPSLTSRGEHSILFRRMEGEQRNSPHRYNFTPRGQNSLLGDNFAPEDQSLPLGGEVKNGPQVFTTTYSDFVVLK
jgi:hypothetical protein